MFESRFGVLFGTAVFIILFLLNYFIFDLLNSIKQMPYTNENTSNTIEDKNTIKSRTYFHCGPQHKTAQDKTLTVCVIINKNLIPNKNK